MRLILSALQRQIHNSSAWHHARILSGLPVVAGTVRAGDVSGATYMSIKVAMKVCL